MEVLAILPEAFVPLAALFNSILPFNFKETDASKQYIGPRRSEQLQSFQIIFNIFYFFI